MRKGIVLALLLALVFFCHSDCFAKRRPFVRGLFAIWNMGCEPPVDCPCCPAHNWQNERNLLLNLHANHLAALWDTDTLWMDNVCNSLGGDVKMNGNIGHDWGLYPWYYPAGWWQDYITQYANAEYAKFGQDAGMFGYYVGHEPVPPPGQIYNFYRGLNFMCWKADDVDPNADRYSMFIANTFTSRFGITSSFSDSVSHLDYFETDPYPYYGTTPPSGQNFQNNIDWMLGDYNNLMNWFKDDSVSWMANIQTSAWTPWPPPIPAFLGYCDTLWNGDSTEIIGYYYRNRPYGVLRYPSYRFPSTEELRLQAFLAISRGAKGLRGFTYSTYFCADCDTNDNHPDDLHWGLLHFRNQRAPFNPAGQSYAGDTLTNYYPDTLAYCFGDESRWPYWNLSDLYSDLAPHGELLTNLYVTGAGSFRQNRDSTVTFIKGIRCSDSVSVVPPGYWWEVSTFTDTATINDADYFMLVNRITCNTGRDNWQPAGKRGCSVIFTRPEGYKPVIQEIFSGRDWWFADSTADSTVAGESWWTFTDSVGPGDGNLYRMNDIFFVGPVGGNVTLDHDVILTQDLVITSTGTLTVNPGVDIYVYPDTDAYNQGQYDNLVEIICQGGGHLNAAGTSSDSVRFIPWQSQEPGDWGGIYIDDYGHCDLDYSSITNAYNGVEVRSYADLVADHCNISYNVWAGIFCHKSDLKLRHSLITGNGDYGVYGYYAGAYIYASKFIDNDAYQIYLANEAVSGDSTLLLYDTLTTVSNPWGYGIYVGAIDKAEVYKCFVDRHQQYALTLNNSNAYVHNSVFACHLTLGGLVGIYADNYSFPRIRSCSLDSLIICVKTNSSKPDMGTVGSYGDCSLSLNGQVGPSSTYYIYHSYRAFIPDTFYAQYNYYYTPQPNPQKFYYVYPTSPIKYWPWRTQPPPPPKMEGQPQIPFVFAVKQNYPNPFNPMTAISFSLDQPGFTQITVYNILGQRVISLASQEMAAGEHVVIWDGRTEAGEPVSSGVYFYAIQTAEHFEAKKMTLLR